MNRTLSLRTALSIGLVGVCVGTLIAAYARADSSKRPEMGSFAELLGSQLPAVSLKSVDGRAVTLADRLSHGPSLIIVLGMKDCFSCNSYRLELDILKSKLPGITPILIGSGSDERMFQDYFRRDHLQAAALLDTDRRLVKALGVNAEPLVLLVDATGRILFADNRSSSAAAQFPFGKLFPLLGAILQPAPTLTTNTGEPNR